MWLLREGKTVQTVEPPRTAPTSCSPLFPAAARDHWFASLTPSFLEIKTVLFEPGEVIEHVYFPLNGVISLVTPLEDGTIVEVATVGNAVQNGVACAPEGTQRPTFVLDAVLGTDDGRLRVGDVGELVESVTGILRFHGENHESVAVEPRVGELTDHRDRVARAPRPRFQLEAFLAGPRGAHHAQAG